MLRIGDFVKMHPSLSYADWFSDEIACVLTMFPNDYGTCTVSTFSTTRQHGYQILDQYLINNQEDKDE